MWYKVAIPRKLLSQLQVYTLQFQEKKSKSWRILTIARNCKFTSHNSEKKKKKNFEIKSQNYFFFFSVSETHFHCHFHIVFTFSEFRFFCERLFKDLTLAKWNETNADKVCSAVQNYFSTKYNCNYEQINTSECLSGKRTSIYIVLYTKPIVS